MVGEPEGRPQSRDSGNGKKDATPPPEGRIGHHGANGEGHPGGAQSRPTASVKKARASLIRTLSEPGITNWAIILLTAIIAWATYSSDQTFDRQLTQMRGQLDVMKAERRPWVTLDDSITITEPLTFDETGARVGFSATYRNGGKSIAQHVNAIMSRLYVEPILPEGVSMSASDFGRYSMRGLDPEGCTAATITNSPVQMPGRLLFPESSVDVWPGGVGHLKLPRQYFSQDRRGKIAVWIDVCVVYRDDTGSVHGTPLILTFTDSQGRANFEPVGVVNGTFKAGAGWPDPF